jgi:hypothetical protein
MIDSINILNTEKRGDGQQLFGASVTSHKIFTGFIASLSNILTDSSEIDSIVSSIITSFLCTNEDNTFYSVNSIVPTLAYKVCRL